MAPAADRLVSRCTSALGYLGSLLACRDYRSTGTRVLVAYHLEQRGKVFLAALVLLSVAYRKAAGHSSMLGLCTVQT